MVRRLARRRFATLGLVALAAGLGLELADRDPLAEDAGLLLVAAALILLAVVVPGLVVGERAPRDPRRG